MKAGRQDPVDPWQREHHAGEGRDAAGGVAYQSSERDAEDRERCEEQRVADHRAKRVRMPDRDIHVLVCQHGLGDEERQER